MYINNILSNSGCGTNVRKEIKTSNFLFKNECLNIKTLVSAIVCAHLFLVSEDGVVLM